MNYRDKYPIRFFACYVWISTRKEKNRANPYATRHFPSRILGLLSIMNRHHTAASQDKTPSLIKKIFYFLV